MGKKALNPEWLQGQNIWAQDSFVPASSQDPPRGVVVLHEAFLDLPSTSLTGMPGVFSRLPEHKDLGQPSPISHPQGSYDLAVEDIPLSANKIIRYIIYPSSDITVIPMSLKSNSHSKIQSTNDSIDTQDTVYSLQSRKGGISLISGLSVSIKLDLVVWDFERFTREGGIYGGAARKFQIDGAVLLDPKLPDQFHPSKSPVCLLGMDFIMKYPYLLFEPKYDARGEIDFILARGPLVYRPYSISTEVKGKLVVHISARYDEDTGRIGCGVFFKSGSILNSFSGVSKYDKDGNKHAEQLWERGILMGVIKALHTVGAFPAGHEFTDVIIRTGCPPINSELSQMQRATDDLQKNSREDGYAEFLNDRLSCPLPNRDLVAYIYRQFIRKQPGIRIRFHGFSTNENYDAVEAAGILASAGAEMEEFHMENEVRVVNAQNFSDYSISRFRSHKHTKLHDITLLNHHSCLVSQSIYASLGLDGYFHIPKEKAHMAMKAADNKACLSLSREDVVCSLGYAPWEGEVAAEPNGFLDTKNYEYHAISPGGDFKTLGGILGEDTAKELKIYLKETPKFTQEKVLQIIQGSKREVKVHEFLSIQTKEYREGYLKELERMGLEEGWKFCKDKNWNGYLRKNTRIYNMSKYWMRPQDKEEMQMVSRGFTLSGENNKLSYWGEEKGAEKVGYAGNFRGRKQKESIFRGNIGIELTDARKGVGICSQTNGEHKEPHHRARLEKGAEAKRFGTNVGSDSSSDSNPNSLLPYHLLGDDFNHDSAESSHETRIKNSVDNKKLHNSGDPQHVPVTGCTSDKIGHMGIGVRVAARRRNDPQRQHDLHVTFLNRIPDSDDKTEDNSDLDYRLDVSDSNGHSSELWLDLEDSTDSGDSNYITYFNQKKKDYLRDLDSMNISQKWKPRFGVGLAAGAGIVNEGNFKLEHGEHEGKGAKGLMPQIPGNNKSNISVERVKDKWPPFDWMLQNFREEYPVITV